MGGVTAGQRQGWRLLGLQAMLLALLWVKLHSVLIESTLRLAWNDPDWGHALLVPLVSGFLIWDRRDALAKLELKGSLWFLVPLVPGLAIYFASLFVRSLMLMGVAGLMTVSALVIAIGGWRLFKLLAFPIFYLAFMMDVDVFLEPLSRVLQGIAVAGAAESIAVIGPLFDLEAWRTGNVIRLFYQGQPVEPPLNVAEACSGLRMLVSLTAAGAAMAGLLYRPWWFRSLVALATVPIAIIVNVGRIVVLALLAPHFPDLSHGELHTHTGGIVMLVPAILLFLGFIRILDWVIEPLQGEVVETAGDGDDEEGEPVASSEDADEPVTAEVVADEPEESDQTTDDDDQEDRWHGWRPATRVYYGLALAILALAAFGEIRMTQALEAALMRAGDGPARSFDQLPTKFGKWERVRVVDYDERIREELGTPYFIDWVYHNVEDPRRSLRFHLAYYSGNAYMIDTWHVPEVCYVGSGQSPVEAGYEDVEVAGTGEVTMRRFSFSSGKDAAPATVFYTFLANGKYVANRHSVKYKALDWRIPTPYVCKIEVLPGEAVRDGAGNWALVPNLAGEEARAIMTEFLQLALPEVENAMPALD